MIMAVACKKCKRLFEEKPQECPYDGSKDFSKTWKGMVLILNPEKSEMAKELGIKDKGRFALKV